MRFAQLLVALVLCALVSACNSASPTESSPYAPAPGPDAFGQRCAKTEECASLLCLRVDALGGVCTRACETSHDCPAAANWGCVQPDDLSHPVCACRPYPAKACGDDLDNDCDGVVDPCQTCGGIDVPIDDANNCGACGVVCGSGQRCTGGACACATPALTACGASCVDTANDSDHCGSCDEICPTGTTCVAGACHCTAPTPDACGATCTSLQSDGDNCGACGVACNAEQTCTGGKCTCPASAPNACGGVCVDTKTDASNCGACGAACGAEQTCASGKCACIESGDTACGGTCVTTQTDPANCGSCGHACGAEQTCATGACVCPSGVTCGGVCESANDSNNCGACGKICPQGQQCSSGACTCVTSGLTACGASCLNTHTDPANCGACGFACPPTEQCAGGTCACATGTLFCADSDAGVDAGACVSTQTSNTDCGSCGHVCPAVEHCVASQCACTTSGQTYCPTTNTCVSTLTDAANCGACLHACAAVEQCSAGQCICKTSGEIFCPLTSTCVNVATDGANCGSCGHACPAASQCSGGQCACTTSGQTYCPISNTCANTVTSNANCGTCGNACPAATTCVSSSCACNQAGLTLCGASCVDTQSNAADCGACGNICGGALVCTTSLCRCPAPVSASAERVTTSTVDASDSPAIAFSGTHAAVLFTTSTIATPGGNDIHVAILNPDGSRLSPSDVALTAFAAGGPSSAAVGDIVWTGSGWAAVWSQTWTRPAAASPTTDIMFQALAADGTPQGTPTDVTALTSGTTASPGSVRLAYGASQGFAIASSLPSGGASFQLLGADGAHPGTVTAVPVSGAMALQAIAAAPDGGWGVFAQSGNSSVFQAFNADGTAAGGPVAVATTFVWAESRAALAYDGASWIAAWTEFTIVPGATGHIAMDITVARGPSFGTQVKLGATPGALGTTPLGIASLAVAGEDVAIVWESGAGSPYQATLARYRAPSDPTAALVPLTDPMPLVTTQNVVGGSLVVAATGATSLLATWGDTRAGHHEIYAQATDFESCQ